MAFQDVAEIKTAMGSFRNDSVFLKKKARYETDYNLWRLKPYSAGTGYYSYTTNTPRVFADKVISLLSDSKLLISIPEELLTEEELHIASNVERFWYGCLNMNDEKLLLMPQRPTLRSQMAWHAAVRGGFGIRVYAHKNEDGETFPDVKIWDIYSMTYGRDNKGISWATHEYPMTKEQAEKDYKVTKGQYKVGSNVTCVDYWDREKYGLIIEGELAENFTKHNLGYCPVAVIGAGAAPEIWQDNYQETGVHVGESCLAAGRDVFPAMSKTYSDLVTIVRRGVKVPMGLWSASGQKTIDEDIFQVDKAAVVPFQTGEEFKPLIPQTMPPDTGNVIALMTGEVQRATFPNTVYGDLGFRLSGFAINQLQGSIATVVEPFAEALERGYTIICLWLLRQYTSRSLPPIKVRGRTAKNQAFGYPKAVQVKASELEGDWHPEIKLEPVLPRDDAQRYQLAGMARDGEIPLFSDRTIRGDILGVQDPDLESDQIDREWADRMILNRLQDAYFRAVEVGDFLKSQNYLVELKRIMSQMAMPQGAGGQPGKRGAPTAYQAMAGQTGEGTVGETGVPPSTLPAEAMGGAPPGAVNAIGVGGGI